MMASNRSCIMRGRPSAQRLRPSNQLSQADEVLCRLMVVMLWVRQQYLTFCALQIGDAQDLTDLCNASSYGVFSSAALACLTQVWRRLFKGVDLFVVLQVPLDRRGSDR